MRRSWTAWAIPAAFMVAFGAAGIEGGAPLSAHAKGPGQGEGAEAHAGDGVVGEWWTEDNEGRVRFERHDGTYRGIATYRKPAPATPDNPDTDLHNPNPKRRGRSNVGIVLIWSLRYEDGRYRNGYVYNPRNGGTYRFEAELVDRETLKVRGYMGFRLFGANQTWKRYHGR